jgi:hypothetical protein
VLPARVVLNRVYVLLVANRDAESRAELDGELWAPVGGWDAAERDLWRRIDEAGMTDGEAR